MANLAPEEKKTEYITKKKKEESDKQIAMDQAVADAQQAKPQLVFCHYHQP